MTPRLALGLDFGTESARAILVAIGDGTVIGQAAVGYAHGVIDRQLPGSNATLPPDYALQDPRDWLDSAAAACKKVLNSSNVTPEQIVGIGGAFTSCTMLPAVADGTPLCLLEQFKSVPLAWPKLWKHHAAKDETDRINKIARDRNEAWLKYYGGIVGLEWFFPKVLETLNHRPDVYEAAEVWIEAGDWLVWQLTNGPFPDCSPQRIVRSTCQAGYKAMWNRDSGYPTREYFGAVHPSMADVVGKKMPGELRSPAARAGVLTERAAHLLGLKAGTPVATAIIDAHAGVPGAGVGEPDTMVLVLGTSACHMLNSRLEKFVPGVAGVVCEGILPGYFGYETGQASVGDAFGWLVEQFKLDHIQMMERAKQFPPGSGGVLALDWLNGCRTPLMDGRLTGGFVGLTLGTEPAQVYRALIEATGFGLRWIVDTLREGGVSVKRFVASGGLPVKNPLLMQIYADILGSSIALAESQDSVAVGAAILGCLAAGESVTGYKTIHEAVAAMGRQRSDLIYQPDRTHQIHYDKLYVLYRKFAESGGIVSNVMRALRNLNVSE
jgi:L-ribulokinase